VTRLGVDIGGTSVKAALVRDGAVEGTHQSAAYRRPDLEQLRIAIGEAVDGLAIGDGAKRDLRVGVCVPGLFDEEVQSVRFSANVPGVMGVRIDQLLAGVLWTGQGARVVTDAFAAGFDVWATERCAGRLLAMSLGTGVGAAVLDDGEPLVVFGRSCGHLGQLDVTVVEPGREVPMGPDGGRGGLEAYIGLPALMARYGCGAEEAAARVTGSSAPLIALARAIRIAHAIYRPDHIRLLGGVGLGLKGVMGELRREVEDGLTRVARAGWTLGAGSTLFHAAIGAARLG